MSLHLIKLSVGTEDLEDLRRWQVQRLRQTGRVLHRTRMTPRRGEELLAGGSIYWIIRGWIQGRQRLIGLEPTRDEAGRPATLLLLQPELVRVVPRRHRAFQGWRYLRAADAPADLEALPKGLREMPPEMAAELHALGLI